jgi:Flp pilus assembly pilin Flp
MTNISSDRAQTTTEYGILSALVLVAVLATVFALGGAVESLWNSVITAWPV